MIGLSIGKTLAVALVCALSCRRYLHMFQLESYQLDGYARWLKRNREQVTGGALSLGVIATVAAIGLQLLLGMFLGQNGGQIASSVVTTVGFAFAAWRMAEGQAAAAEKKPLVFTARMKRLCAALALVTLLLSAALNFVGIPPYLLFAAVPVLVLAAAYLMQPVEKRINDFYLNQAKAKLAARPDLIKIGITGSFGKTSTKFCMAQILSAQFDVLATPASFNTPMGLTRVIREKLEAHHQVFIAEMGARHVGDIRELCELVHPSIGVLTSVGAQHLETFGDIATVARTKNELIEALPADGLAVFAADGGWVDKLYEQATCKKLRVGLAGGYLNLYAEDIQSGSFGSRFTLCDGEGARVVCQTRLLGKLNILNILLGCAVGKALGMSMEALREGVSRVEPIEHRLQLIPGANDMLIIDDAFNANPVGAQMALEVLSAFPGRHVIVTPGFVEQGEREAELNRKLGGQIAQLGDVAILVGKKHVQPIAQGALAAGFDGEKLFIVDDLDAATQLLAEVGRAGDVILFENDLPDNYNE